MIQTRMTTEQREDFVRRADEVYRRDIRPKVIDEHRGKYIMIDPDSGDYAVDEDELGAVKALRARRPETLGYLTRIGFTSAAAIGTTLRPDEP